MRDISRKENTLAGSLLLSHPSMTDPNFGRTVILLSIHSSEEGAVGIVLNRPLGKCLGDLQEEFAMGPLAKVPLYSGGPVSPEKIIFTAWKWAAESEDFEKIFFGMDAEAAQKMLSEEPDLDVRAFIGHAGWTAGQIEHELQRDSWIVSPIDGDAIRNEAGVELWRRILLKVKPDLRILADAPEDPSLN